MKYFLLLFAFVASSMVAIAQKATIIQSPAPIPVNDERKMVFLGGSIDMGTAENWQATLEQQLSNEPVILLNPRRTDWNKEWKPLSTDSNFRIQVEWELEALEKADIIIMYFLPQSQSPISLLELGLHAKTGKLMVVCPEGYWRKGNVDITCEKYQVKMYKTINELIAALKPKLQEREGSVDE